MSGYARAHRGRWDHPLFKTKQEAAVWAWMTDTARFRAHSFQTSFGMVHLQRGQLLISERGIADDFGLHKNTVRRLLSTMQQHGMILLNRDHKASRAGTIATIVNYERYQSDAASRNDAQDQGGTKGGTETGPTQDQGGTTREERKKREEGEEKSPSDSSPGAGDQAGDEPNVPVRLSLVPTIDRGADPAAEAFAAYERLRHSIDPSSRTATLSPDRRKKLAARLDEIGGAEAWAEVLAIVHASRFLRGEGARGGRLVATIDWLLKPENLRKVREGNYDERTAKPASAGSTVSGGAFDSVLEARAILGRGGSGVRV